ncbi:MAG: oligosaccharide flippase family protein, partial [Clostridia bacterium]|nr:oligosaccharide flippase family protein [Clostridia bacterium]
MSQKKLVRDLTVGNLTPVLLKFAIPVMLSNLLQTAYNMADMVIVGKYVSSAGLSAVSVGGDVMHFYMFLGMGFATAGQIMIAQYVGAGKKSSLNQVIGTLFTFVLLLSATLGMIGA